MAEYARIMRNVHRMCKLYKSCNKCPLFIETDGCMAEPQDIFMPKETERRVLEWERTHPAPVYPSWYEYQQQTFPGHTRWICPMAFGVQCQCKSVTSVQACTKCRNSPIPAEIAEKLGIMPKEG